MTSQGDSSNGSASNGAANSSEVTQKASPVDQAKTESLNMTNQSDNTSQVGASNQANTALPAKPVPPSKLQPGQWGPIPRQQPIDPAAAKAKIESRPLPTRVYDPKAPRGVFGALAAGAEIKSLAAGFASNTVGGPASIVELARALRNDVDLIFEWVFNNIENHVTYGLQKGAVGAIIDGFGNSFDQSDVMVQLLRQAGYTANYVNGELRMNGAQAADWLGTDPLNVFAAANFLANCLVPVTTVWNGVEWVMDFSHTWVVVNISGTNYVFDPALKTYTAVSGINLASAMGYNATTFMTDATSGATVTADYVQNMNRTNIRANLDTLSNNLVSWIKANDFDASMDDILGGRTINQYDAATQLRQTAHPFLKPGSTPVTWTSIAAAYKTTMRVFYDTIDVTFYSDDLAGKRLSLFFNVNHEAELRLDGTLIATSSAQTPGTWNSVLLEIVHPYPYTWADQSTWFQIWADKPYLLCHSFGNTTRGASQVHSRKQKSNTAAGLAMDSEPVMGEMMAAMWKMWDAAGTRLADIINRMTNCTTANHHAAGIIGWFDTPFTNIGMVKWSTGALDNNYNNASTNDTVLAMHGVAMETQIFNQFAKIDGISTTPLVDIANSGGLKIYDASSTNWVANVRPNLTNYVSTDLDDIKAWWIDNGYRVGIPEDGQITRGSWTGFGYYAIPTFGTFGIIQGGLKGGSGADFLTQTTWATEYSQGLIASPGGGGGGGGGGGAVIYDQWRSVASTGSTGGGGGNGWMVPDMAPALPWAFPVQSAEPIDMTTGDYLFSQSDIAIGSAGFPYGLSFGRTYNSRARLQDSRLGLGWRHNFESTAQVGTDALAAMGSHSVIAAAATIAELFVAVDIQTDLSKPFNKYITCALASQWFIDNLIENTVMITAGHAESNFIKLRDGTYAAPCGDNGTLTFSTTYKYKTLGGVEYNFNTDGNIATVVFPAGVTVTYTYTSGKLTSVTNGMGRTLTLSYTGDRLTSVSDGTGRSVSYTIDGSKNLTVVTDPNGKNWTHEYDLPGRMTKVFKPANPLVAVATNVYDTLDRVKEQRDYLSNLWQYYFAGSRSQEVNPNGKGSVIYIGQYAKVVKSINQVGKISTSEYDGRARLIKATAPEGNSVELVYDTKDRVTQTTAKAKPLSGLGDIVSSVTYDTTWGGVKTATDPMGRVTTMNYDVANGNLLSVVSPTVTGVGASTVTMTYNARGQVLTITAPDGIVTKNTYDVSTEALLSTVADFGVGRLNLTANFGYNSRGQITSVQDPRGFTSTVTPDVLGRVTQATTTAPFSFVTKFTYDDNGNTTKVERQTNDPDNPWQTTQATYAADDKVLTMTGSQVFVTTIDYDSLRRLWKTTDPLSRVVTRAYDDANRISTITNPASIVEVTYTYTDNGKLASLKDARNNTTTYTFDGHDRADKTTYPDATYEQVTSRDGNSNPLTVRTRSAATVTLTYDELNRVKTKAPSGQPTVTTVYDIAGRVTTVSTPVVAGDPSSGTFTNFYDTAGRFYKEQYPDGLSVTHVLDANGNVTKTTYPDGYFVDRVYDELNRLTDIKLNGAGTSAVQFAYDALSRRTKLTYENGCTTSYGFELDNDLNGQQHNFVGSNVGFQYAFDNASQMVTQRTTDPANFRWTPGAPATVSYGTANNINQYPTVGGTGYTYSTDGNLTNDGTFKFEFNTERMMIRVRNAGTNAIISDYLYDPALRQRQKNVGGTKTNFYYAGWQRLADYDATAGTPGTLLNRYVYGTGLDEVLLQITSGGTKTYYHGNHQGSVVATTNSSGNVVNRYKYSPYGESPIMSGTTHGYTGQRYDSETGLYYYKMRYYSPKLGRFLQADSIGYGDGMNMYGYVGNLPLSRTDALGLAGGGSGGGGSGGSAGAGGGNIAPDGSDFSTWWGLGVKDDPKNPAIDRVRLVQTDIDLIFTRIKKEDSVFFDPVTRYYSHLIVKITWTYSHSLGPNTSNYTLIQGVNGGVDGRLYGGVGNQPLDGVHITAVDRIYTEYGNTSPVAKSFLDIAYKLAEKLSKKSVAYGAVPTPPWYNSNSFVYTVIQDAGFLYATPAWTGTWAPGFFSLHQQGGV